MATAERVIHTIETITLVLTEDEANTLMTVTDHIAGSYTLSPRKHMVSIRGALSTAQVIGTVNWLVNKDDSQSRITFDNYEES